MGRSGLGLHPGSTGPQARRCSQVMGHPCGEGRSRRRTGRCHEEDGDGVCVGSERWRPESRLRASTSGRPSAETVAFATFAEGGRFRPRRAVIQTFRWRSSVARLTKSTKLTLYFIQGGSDDGGAIMADMADMRNMWNMETWGGRETWGTMGTMGLSGRGSVPVLQGVAKPTALLWDLSIISNEKD